MNRLEELILKWQDGSLSTAELREFNALLNQPEARERLVREFQFDSLTRESLRELAAESATQAAAAEFTTVEMRKARVESSAFNLTAALACFVRSFTVRVALAAAVVTLVAWLVLRPDPTALVLVQGSAGVTVERRSQFITVPASRFALRAGDKIVVSDAGRAELINREGTVAATLTGPGMLALQSPAELELDGGEMGVTASGRTPLRVRAGATVAAAENGSFRLNVETNLVRLEVESGTVNWQRLDDGRELTVAAGYFAVAGVDEPFIVQSLVPQPWLVQDVGKVAETVVARFEGDVVRLTSGNRGGHGPPGPPGGFGRFAGKGKGKGKHRGGEEGFHFVYRELRGDGEIRARVLPTADASGVEAGLVIRRDLTDESPMVFVGSSPGQPPEFRRGFRGGRFRSNNSIGDEARRGPPYWLRLIRQGTTVIAYRSDDGEEWTETGTETLDLNATAFVGLAAATTPSGDLASVRFDNIQVVSRP